MFESEIRNQTKTIIEAYQKVTGGTPILDISNFLLLRNQAEKELSSGIGTAEDIIGVTEPKPVIQKQPVSESDLPRFAEPQKEKTPVSMKPPKPAVSKLPKTVKKESAAEPEGILDDGIDPLSEDTEEPPSDFSILRSIKDPWN